MAYFFLYFQYLFQYHKLRIWPYNEFRFFVSDAGCPDRFGLSGKFVENSNRNYIALELPVIGSSTVHCYGFQNFKSGVAERFRRRYILQTVTAELQTANVAYFHSKIQLSGFSAYPDCSPSQLIRISGVLLQLNITINGDFFLAQH